MLRGQMAAPGAAAMETLASVHRPAQFGLLARAADVLTESRQVSALLVRGSLARGTSDRLSDIDLVVGVEDEHFGNFVDVVDLLMTTALGAIMPGWRDSIVADMGGLGFVYLVAHEERLYQFDLYAAPASVISGIVQTTGAREIFTRSSGEPSLPNPAVFVAPNDVISATWARPASCSELLVEVLVLGLMIKKRLVRGQTFMAFGEWQLLLAAFRDLIKTALVPTSQSRGWYKLLDEVGVTPIGRECLDELSVLMRQPTVPDPVALAETVHQIVAVVERAAPQSVEQLRSAIDAYRYYLDLP
ncbi:hypothetical protein GCM10022223_60110 [Kineosporia mesophila]|uniref:Polymerase nucleotidyl transferase domain-containing protein n=2 Tax=Kineosporia mesophila TaxID=566012 RepID=A0ABP7AIZ3_9ACTN